MQLPSAKVFIAVSGRPSVEESVGRIESNEGEVKRIFMDAQGKGKKE